MENKRELIIKKIDRFAFNAKNLNIVIAVMISLFLIFFAVICSKESAELKLEEERYRQMLADIEEHQLNVIYSNVSSSEGYVDESQTPEKPIFKDAKEAVVYAFEKLYNYNSFEIITKGTNTSEALGQKVTIKNTGKIARFEDGVEYELSKRLEIGSNFGQSGADEAVFKNGNRFVRYGKNIQAKGDDIAADFEGPFQKANSKQTAVAMHLVNKDTVIVKRSFSFVRDKENKIEYYKASVLLDPELSTKTYGINVQEQGGTSYPEFSKVELSCIIDRDGNLMSYQVNQTMKVVKTVLINVTATVQSEITYTVLSFNKQPSIAEPKI